MSHILKTNASIPVSPRTSIYFPDGHGRDSYIFNNNGGLSKSGLRVVNFNESSGNFNGTRYTNLARSPGPIRYFCNGTGRDTYVNFNSGGFQKISNVSGDLKLNSIVRNHDFKISPYLPEYNSPKKTNSPFKTRKEVEASKGLRVLENNIINRLYYSCSKTMKNSNPLTTKNSSYLVSSINTKENGEDSNINLINGLNDYKNTSKGTKKINFSDFTNYLDKLANYENRQRVNGKKY